MPDTDVSSPKKESLLECNGFSSSSSDSDADDVESKGHSGGDEKESVRIRDTKKIDGLEDIELPREARNRVKLYVLCEQRVWDDRGTGHVACVQIPNDSGFAIVVRLEAAESNVLESRVHIETVYQKQQETLIVWSESESCDLALSFQEKSGCEEIWAKICEVQGRDPGEVGENTFDENDDAELSEGSVSGSKVVLPPIELGRLSEIDSVISNHMATQSTREKMANVVEQENTVPKLVELFHICEDMEHVEGLRTIYSIAKNLFMLNRNSLNEILLSNDHLKDMIGMLEYDPANEKPKKHREFLFDKAQFREVLPINNVELREKIHQTYRVQYLQDVCLPAPSLFEENLLSVLNSYLFFSRIDIVTLLHKDKELMKMLFEQLKDPATTVGRRKDLAMFLKEFITLSQGLPPNGAQSKENFFKSLQTSDVLGAIEKCIESPDVSTRETVVDVLYLIVDNNPQQVRDYLLKQAKDKDADDILLNKLIGHMLSDRDPELTSANQVSQILKTLLDPDNMVSVQKSERSEFLHLFYQKSITTLEKPLLDNMDNGVIKKDDYCTAHRHALIVRMLGFCIEHHSLSMRQHCISTNLLNKVLVALDSKHHFLSLFALKLLRRVLGCKDEFYNRYLVREHVLDKVVACFKKNGSRYNLLNSAILELFEFIRSEDIKLLVKYTVENHMETFEKITYVKVFTDLKLRYDQQKERESKHTTKNEERAASPPTFLKERQEELWFEDDEDQDEEKKEIKKETESSPRKSGAEPMFPSLLKRKNAVDDDDGAVFSGSVAAPLAEKKSIVFKMGDRSRTPSPSSSPVQSPGGPREDEVSSSQNNSKESSPVSSVKSLVDYDESDSDEDADEAHHAGAASTAAATDSVPSSSTGSPVPPAEGQEATVAASEEAAAPHENGCEKSETEKASEEVSSTSDSPKSYPVEDDDKRKGKRPSSGTEDLEDDVKRVRTEPVAE